MWCVVLLVWFESCVFVCLLCSECNELEAKYIQQESKYLVLLRESQEPRMGEKGGNVMRKKVRERGMKGKGKAEKKGEGRKGRQEGGVTLQKCVHVHTHRKKGKTKIRMRRERERGIGSVQKEVED